LYHSQLAEATGRSRATWAPSPTTGRVSSCQPSPGSATAGPLRHTATRATSCTGCAGAI
jgi:hypothetical protein